MSLDEIRRLASDAITQAEQVSLLLGRLAALLDEPAEGPVATKSKDSQVRKVAAELDDLLERLAAKVDALNATLTRPQHPP